MAILKQKAESKTKQINIRIDSTIVDEVEAIKRDAEAAGFVFDVAEIVTRSLQSSARQARAELSQAKNADA